MAYNYVESTNLQALNIYNEVYGESNPQRGMSSTSLKLPSRRLLEDNCPDCQIALLEPQEDEPVANYQGIHTISWASQYA